MLYRHYWREKVRVRVRVRARLRVRLRVRLRARHRERGAAVTSVGHPDERHPDRPHRVLGFQGVRVEPPVGLHQP